MDVQAGPHGHAKRVGFVETTIKAFKGRTIHTFHTQGAGGTTPPISSKYAASQRAAVVDNNPALYRQHHCEHLDMLMVCHHLDPSIAEDMAFAESRIRKETIAARIFCTISAPDDVVGLQAMGRAAR
jgi:urease subunit alpha